MKNRILRAFIAACVLLTQGLATDSFAGQQGPHARTTVPAEAKTAKRVIDGWGLNNARKITVLLWSGKKISGRVVAIEDYSFSIRRKDKNPDSDVEIFYLDVNVVYPKESNGRRWIVVAGAAATAASVIIVARQLNRPWFRFP